MTRPCVTHHQACDCREARFREIEAENERLASRLDTRQRAATEAFALLQKHYDVADCVMPNDLDDLESAMKLLMGDSHAWETTAAGYCPKRYQARNAMIPACDCAHGICSNRLNDNYAGDVENQL